MPPTLPDRPPLRSVAERVAELNAAIRALWIGPGGHPAVGLTDEQKVEYHSLLAELDALRAVEPGNVVEAA